MNSNRRTQNDGWGHSTTVAHKYNTPLVCTLLLRKVVFLLCWALFGSSKHFSVFLLCQAFSFYLEQFFGCTKQFSPMLSPFLVLSTIFLLCWARLGSVRHISTMLSTLRLYQAFFFYAEGFYCSAKLFIGYAEPFSSLPSIFFYAVQYTAEENTWQSIRTT